MTQKPRLAATVILLRPADPRGFEVFLTRRAEDMAVLGGMYCFPGGTLRSEDFSEPMLRRAVGMTFPQARTIIGAHLPPRQALGLWIAAIRELYEEAGILLAVNGAGESVLGKDVRNRRIGEKRPCSLGTPANFAAFLESQGLFCDLGALAHFSHWQTPAHVATRFDTHFFLACAPAHQCPLPASSEVAHSIWLTPDAALRLFNQHELPIIFPTFASLRILADYDSLESVLKPYRATNHKP
jgi:8-oxo-dGTP pyrophosphatase MutT (NUDIX family)